jgi:uncharacterized protein (TIGR00369 family)
LNGGQGCTTLELKIAYHAALTSTVGRVLAEGKVVSIGERVAFAEGRLTDACGNLYAAASSTSLIHEQRVNALESL